MNSLLKEAIGEVENLPVIDQEEIGRRLLSHVEKLRALRMEIDGGMETLNAGEGTSLNMQEFIQSVKHGGV